MAENEIVVKTSRDAVYDVLCDGWTYSNWVVGTSHMRAVASDWPAVGAKLHHSTGMWPVMMEDETEVTALEPGRRLVLAARGRPFGEARVELELSDADDGCRVVIRERPIAGIGKALDGPVLDALLRRRNAETLERLAALSERRVRPEG